MAEFTCKGCGKRVTLYYVRCPNCHRTGRKSLTEYQAEKKWNEEGVKHGGN